MTESREFCSRGAYSRSPFVLIHGAWHGGWCWQKVTPFLRQAGAVVYAPSLSGLGDRAHLAEVLSPEKLDLDLHIQDVANLLESEGLEQVILAGHAYAGMVLTGVAERCPERLAHLVFVNGVVPQDGEAMVDQLEAVRGPQFADGVRQAIAQGQAFLPPPATAAEVERRWGIHDTADQQWVLSRITPQPVAAFAQPVRVGNPQAQAIPRSFIMSSESGFDPVAELARRSGWGLYHVDSGHDPMITNPEEVAGFLLRVAAL